MTQYGAPGGGSWQFNAPPGWPPPEPGWAPPPNWQPEPSWPPAPANWLFWIPVGYAPAVPPPESRSTRARVVLGGKILAGVLTLAATVAGAWITLVDRPEPYTIDHWKVAANATCERDFGNVQLPLYAATLQVAQVAAALPPAGQQSPTMTAAAQSMGQLASAFRAMNGDFREIRVPDAYDRTNIDALMQATGDMAGTLSMVATFLINYQVGQVNAVQIEQMLTALQVMSTTTMPSWVNAAQRLDLTQCVSIMGTPSGTTPSATSTPTNLTALQQALVDRINPAMLTSCTPAPAAQNEQVTAAVTCSTARSGLAKSPLMMRFLDEKARAAWLATMSTSVTAGLCAESDSFGAWTYNDTAVGTLVCRPGLAGTYLGAWTFDDDNIVVVAEATSRESFYTWWSVGAYVLKR